MTTSSDAGSGRTRLHVRKFWRRSRESHLWCRNRHGEHHLL